MGSKVRYSWLAALFSVVYFGVAWKLASVKQFWNDELFTFYISRLPGMRDVWKALSTGTEQLAPLFYAITRLSAAVFGQGYIAYRLPEMVGYWVMMLSIYSFVKRRSSPAYGLVAMTFPLITGSVSYSYEARPYGIVLGCGGLALLFWRSATEESRRGLALPGLSLSLGIAVSCHYYAVLIFIPFLIGEAVRFVSRKRLDVPLLAAIAAGLAPLILFLPLIRAARKYSTAYWVKPQWSNMLGFYSHLLTPAVVVLMCIPLVAAIGLNRNGEPAKRLPRHEIAAAFGFVLIPFIAVFLAKTITGAFTDRYALPAVIGIAILLAWSLSALGRYRPAPALVISFLAIGLFCLDSFKSYRELSASARSAEATLQFLHNQSEPGSPVVVSDPHLFFELSKVAGDRGAPWLVYLADRDLAVQHTGIDLVELGLMNMKEMAPLRIEDFHSYSGARHSLLIYGYDRPFSWVVQELRKEGWHFTMNDVNAGQFLFLATRPETQASGSLRGSSASLTTGKDK